MPFSTISLFSRFNRLTPSHRQPCILQISDITKGIILQKFSQIKKRDYQLVAISEKPITKSENLTAAGACGPRLPVLIYSKPFVMSQNCKMHGCQWYGVKRIEMYFRE